MKTLTQQRDELMRLLQSALCSTQENVAVILEGLSGCGKSVVLKSCLDQLASECNAFLTVWLNGYIHNQDSIAFEEIIRQLKLTFDDHEICSDNNSKRDEFLTKALIECKENQLPVFVILDDFDVFAHKAKQSLLYYLFDLQQNPAVQICIISTTTRTDSFSLLEKRVRSRFSDRRIVFPNKICEKAKAKMMFERLMTLSKPKNKVEKAYNRSITSTLKLREVQNRIGVLVEMDHTCARQIENILLSAVSELDNCKPRMTKEVFLHAIESQFSEPAFVNVLKDCCLTQLLIVCAMVRLSLMKKRKSYNFVMIMEEICTNENVRQNHRENDEHVGQMLERMKDMQLVSEMPRQGKILRRFRKMVMNIPPLTAKNFIMKMKEPRPPPSWLIQYVRFSR